METGIVDFPVPEPIIMRPIRGTKEIKDYYGWEDMEEEEAPERDDERAPLPYYMGVMVDLLA